MGDFAQVASVLAGMLPNSILSTLGFVFRLIFRREWLTAAAFVFFLTVVSTLATDMSAVIATPFRLLHYVLMVFVMLRFGLFPFVVGSCLANSWCFSRSSLTFQPGMRAVRFLCWRASWR
jgi:hypothetical protein